MNELVVDSFKADISKESGRPRVATFSTKTVFVGQFPGKYTYIYVNNV